jgi:hypothetical protein
VASTEDLEPDTRRTLARMLLPYTEPDQAHLHVLDVREAIVNGRNEADIGQLQAWFCLAGELAMDAALRDREKVSA